MARDFRTNQIQTNKVIASGSTGTNAKILVYPIDAENSAIPNQGSIDPAEFSTGSIGVDTFLYVSGAVGSKDSSTAGTSVFGGDLHVSGNFYVDGISDADSDWTAKVSELHTTSSVQISSSLEVQSGITGSHQLLVGGGKAFVGDSSTVSTQNLANGSVQFAAHITASAVLNDSTVAGDFVDDALNNLSSSVGTMQSSYVTSSIGAETISELQSLGTPSNFTIAFVENHSTTGDNGGGTFIWDSASTDPDNNGTIVLPDGHVGAGRWKRSQEGPINAKWFGLRDDTLSFTTANNTTAIQEALGLGEAYIPPGTYTIDPITFPSSSVRLRGAGVGATLLHGTSSVSGGLVIIQNKLYDGMSDLTIRADSDITRGLDLIQTSSGNCQSCNFNNLRFVGLNSGVQPSFTASNHIAIYGSEAAGGQANYFHKFDNIDIDSWFSGFKGDWNANAWFVSNIKFQKMWRCFELNTHEWTVSNIFWHSSAGGSGETAYFAYISGSSGKTSQYNQFINLMLEPGIVSASMHFLNENAISNYFQGGPQISLGPDSGSFNFVYRPIVGRGMSGNEFSFATDDLKINSHINEINHAHDVSFFGLDGAAHGGSGRSFIKVFGSAGQTRNGLIGIDGGDFMLYASGAGYTKLIGNYGVKLSSDDFSVDNAQNVEIFGNGSTAHGGAATGSVRIWNQVGQGRHGLLGFHAGDFRVKNVSAGNLLIDSDNTLRLISRDGSIHATSSLDVLNNITSSNTLIKNDLDVNGETVVTQFTASNALISNDLTVTDDTAISGTLLVSEINNITEATYGGQDVSYFGNGTAAHSGAGRNFVRIFGSVSQTRHGLFGIEQGDFLMKVSGAGYARIIGDDGIKLSSEDFATDNAQNVEIFGDGTNSHGGVGSGSLRIWNRGAQARHMLIGYHENNPRIKSVSTGDLSIDSDHILRLTARDGPIHASSSLDVLTSVTSSDILAYNSIEATTITNGAQYSGSIQLSSSVGGTYIDAAVGPHYWIELDENTLFENPVNAEEGKELKIGIKQNNIGSNTVITDTAFVNIGRLEDVAQASGSYSMFNAKCRNFGGGLVWQYWIDHSENVEAVTELYLTASTTTTGSTTIAAILLSEHNKSGLIDYSIHAKTTASFDNAQWKIRDLIYRSGSTAILQNQDIMSAYSSSQLFSVSQSINGSVYEIHVSGSDATNVDWQFVGTVEEL